MTTSSAPPTKTRCICRACGECFSTVGNFDKHRKGDHQTGRYCADPASVGLELKAGASGSWWGMPGNYRARKGETVAMYRIATHKAAQARPGRLGRISAENGVAADRESNSEGS